LGITFAVGFIYGPRQGFLFGIIISSLTGIVRFDLSDMVRYGGLWTISLLSMPLIGYAGGRQIEFKKKPSYTWVLQFFAVFYLAMVLIFIIQGSNRPEYYVRIPLFWLQSTLICLVLIFTAILFNRFKARKSDMEEDIKKKKIKYE
jgi:hypothetical protein